MVAHYAERHGGDPELPCVAVSAAELYGPGYDDTSHRVPDISRARELLGWAPRRALERLLPAVIDDYVARYGEARP
jgi:UDP-apiose/xylose synthase